MFREVNERIADLSIASAASVEQPAFICECWRLGCTAIVHVPLEAYERIRENPTTFVVVAGHEDPEHEQVVERAGRYRIVRNKPGVAEQIARETAPTTTE